MAYRFDLSRKIYPLPAAVRRVQIQRGPDRYDARRINLIVRHVIMTLDVIEVDRRRDSVVLIEIAQIGPEILVINNTPQIAFEVAVINSVEADQGWKTSASPFR